MLREILGRVTGCVLWAVVVVAGHAWVKDLDISLAIHNLVGTALGLLLVFRTNSAYDRFWEGRKLWGGMVNESRNLARTARSLLPGDHDTARRVIAWNVALVYAAMCSLRGQKHLGAAARLLEPAEADQAVRADHPVLYCAGRITDTLRAARDAGKLSAYDLVYIDGNVQALVDYVGGCERIRKTPLPFAYLVHLRRALVIYCLALPFALVRDFGWMAVPITLAVSYVFFGLEEIGVEIEDPFGSDDNDLPLDEICGTIERNLLALT
jgi:putative membrane protein